jgi:hypothetical protein
VVAGCIDDTPDVPELARKPLRCHIAPPLL